MPPAWLAPQPALTTPTACRQVITYLIAVLAPNNSTATTSDIAPQLLTIASNTTAIKELLAASVPADVLATVNSDQLAQEIASSTSLPQPPPSLAGSR